MGKGSDNIRYAQMKTVEGEYIPEVDIEYPVDDSASRVVKVRYDGREVEALDEHYSYLDDSFSFKIQHLINRIGMRLFLVPMNRLRYGLRIKGRENLKPFRRQFRSGAITVCNHVYRWDLVSVLTATGMHETFFPILADHMRGKDAWFMGYAGGVPVPESRSGMRAFNAAFDTSHERGKWSHVFPEATSWRFYKPVRSFKKGAFTMAYRYGLPVIPCVISYRERTGIYSLWAKDEPLVTLNVGTPIFPDLSKPRKAETERILKETHAQMVSMAGITHNPWPAEWTEAGEL